MSFKTKKILAILLSILPIIFVLLCIPFSGYINDNDLSTLVIGLAVVLTVLGFVSSFALARCPHCHLPIPTTSLLFTKDRCPYCDKLFDGEEETNDSNTIE